MVCYSSVPNGSPQPDAGVLQSSIPPQRQKLALAGTGTVSRDAGLRPVLP